MANPYVEDMRQTTVGVVIDPEDGKRYLEITTVWVMGRETKHLSAREEYPALDSDVDGLLEGMRADLGALANP